MKYSDLCLPFVSSQILYTVLGYSNKFIMLENPWKFEKFTFLTFLEWKRYKDRCVQPLGFAHTEFLVVVYIAKKWVPRAQYERTSEMIESKTSVAQESKLQCKTWAGSHAFNAT